MFRGKHLGRESTLTAGLWGRVTGTTESPFCRRFLLTSVRIEWQKIGGVIIISQ